MELTTYRDGIFSNSDPIASPGLTAFNDGSLGATTSFRDGLFSQADPMAYPGSLLTSYSDGSLGATSKIAPEWRERVKSSKPCINWCMAVRSRTSRRNCIQSCVRANGMSRNPAAQKKRPVQGLGVVSNTTLIGGALAIGVIGLAFVAMKGKKGKRR